MKIDLEFLGALTEAPGISGHESRVRSLIRNRAAPYADEVRTDAMGNLFITKKSKGRGRKLRVMLAAHMDEVGLLITFVDKSGYLRFTRVGGIDPRLLPAKRVLVGPKNVPGVIGTWPVHFLRRRTDRDRVPSDEELAIDIGASSQEEAQALAGPGDYAYFGTKTERWGDILKAKALDDRLGCYLLTELLKNRYPFDLEAVFTVQEEVGLRGAAVAAYDFRPDLAFILEGTGAADFPLAQKSGQGSTPALGGGPVITVMDRSVFCDRHLVQLLIDTSKSLGIPYQLKRPGIGGTDAGRISLSGGGVRTAVVAVACRYIHSPAALTSIRDIHRCLKLMHESLKHLNNLKI
jgi:putative aminopeptidase FrvX